MFTMLLSAVDVLFRKKEKYKRLRCDLDILYIRPTNI